MSKSTIKDLHRMQMTVYRFAVQLAISRIDTGAAATAAHRRAPPRTASPPALHCRDYIFHPPDIRSVSVSAPVIYADVTHASDRTTGSRLVMSILSS